MGKIYLGTQGGVPFVYDKVEFVGVPRILDNGKMRLGTSAESITVSLNENVVEIGANVLYYGFYQDLGITKADFSNITTISGENAFFHAFDGCTRLNTVDFSALSSMACSYALRYAFRNCSSLSTLSFPSLTTSSFGNYMNQFNSMLSGCTGVTVHFPSSLQNLIPGFSGYPNFGGTNNTVLFDL